MRVRPSLLIVLTALGAFLAAQTALGSTGPAGEPAAPVAEPSAIELASSVVASEAESFARQSAARPTPVGHQLAAVRGEVAVSDRPGGPAVGTLGATTEFGSPRVLGVAARRGGWLGVVTTGRTNGRLGWVRRGAALRLRRTRWSLHADLSQRTLTLRRNGRAVHKLSVAIGAAGNDTPTGRFAVTDKLPGSRFGSYYGCCILALNGIQPNTPPGWTGGNRLAIHGTNAPSTIGSAASAGCLRAGDEDLRVLMARVPLGTPVFIRR
jgi:lipoprotein-anchoring transpeptidase ErfK/SrfK